ncbi:hypothetical protein AB6813_16585 [bacterium RCC_150]
MTRVRVTAPHSAAKPAPKPPHHARVPAEDSDVGQIFVRSLIRSQLRLAVVVAAGFLLVLAAYGTMVALLPDLARVQLFGIPLNWIILGVALYPVIGLSAWLYNRTAAKNEARFRDLVEEQ